MKIPYLLAAACLCAAVATSAQTAPAAPPASAPGPVSTVPAPPPPTATGPSKVAIINIQQAIETTGEGKQLIDALEARFQPKTTELDNGRKEIADLQSKLNAGGNTMSEAAKADLQREITSKQRDLQQAADNANSDYQNGQTDVMNAVGGKMMPIIKKYAEDHGYTAIIDVSFPWPQGPVLYYQPGAVVTGDIIRLYDQANPASASTPKPTVGH